MWDRIYAAEEYVYGKDPNEFLRDNYTAMPMGRVLCLAEGEGRNAVYLAGLGYEVTAVDNSRAGLVKAERLALEKGVDINIVHADLADFDPGARHWDGVVSIFCHLPPALRKSVYRRIEQGLKPGGRLVLEGYTPRQLDYGTGGPPAAELMLTREILQAEMPGLQFELLREIERDVSEGSKHSGLGSVVQAIATPAAKRDDQSPP